MKLFVCIWNVMRLDVAEFKMEYEATRDVLARVRHRSYKPPEWLPGVLREAYGAGYETGMATSTQFDPPHESEPPPEFDWEYEGAWRVGYDDGTFSGRLMREIILERLLKQRGLKFKPV